MASQSSLDRVLEHVMGVEEEMIALSAASHRAISGWMNGAGVAIPDEVLEALQYQDILSQQLGATIEAIGKVREMLAHPSASAPQSQEPLAQIDAKLLEILETAQSKHAAYRGKEGDDSEGIEFF
jgi:hypothetical protein